MKRAAIASLVALLGCSGGHAADHGPATAPKPVPSAAPPEGPDTASKAETNTAKREGREAKLIAKMLREVSHIRGLEATRVVPGVVLPRDALIARVKDHVAKEIPPEAIRREGLAMQILGFLPTTFDYAAEMFALLEQQLAGFYEPADGTMYMAGDLDGENAEATLAHELVHALQDQHWDLKQRSKYRPGQSDRQSALACLAEGDATSAMADIVVSHMDPNKNALDLPEKLFVEQVLGSVSTGPSAKSPHIMRTSLVSPYVDGTLFVHALRRKGGWAMVDRAWAELPATTEQILHVEKWIAHEPALEVSAPTFASLGAGWTLSDEDTYGEQGLRLSLEEWMKVEDAQKAAQDWGGDRGGLFASGEKTAFALHVRFDASPDARGDAFAARAYTSVASALQKKIGTAALKDAAFTCVERPKLGPLLVARKGRDFAITAGPALTTGGWWSQATCVDAKKWATEILGNR